MLHETGYIEALEAERTVEAEGRVENLEELVGVAGEFDANREVEGDQELAPLEEFLAQISLYHGAGRHRATTESLATLMSLHNAKGLEYEAVFIIGCEEGVFPHSRSIEEGNLEEERRLAYVGVTRARERLWMTHARRRSLLRRRQCGTSPRASSARSRRRSSSTTSTTTPTGWSGGGGDARQRATGFGRRRLRAERRGPRMPAPKQAAPPPVPYAVGDDVVHATFGEGVVTAVEPGSVVVVRFAGDGGERKLMADYAPLQRAA